MTITCKPDVTAEEQAVVAHAINLALGRILSPAAAENAAYKVLLALRGAASASERGEDLTRFLPPAQSAAG